MISTVHRAGHLLTDVTWICLFRRCLEQIPTIFDPKNGGEKMRIYHGQIQTANGQSDQVLDLNDFFFVRQRHVLFFGRVKSLE